MNARGALAVDAARTAAIASRLLGRGGGTALPGLVALRVDSSILRRLAGQLGRGTIAVSGTNGKTTTSAMLAGILEAAGLRVLRNGTGSNLTRGIASSLIARSGWRGEVRGAGDLVGLFEVDEGALPEVVGEIRPDVAVLLDLFRDQLDRYGEVASVARHWIQSLSTTSQVGCLVANADDPLVTHVALSSGLPVRFFGVDGVGSATQPDHASDVKSCPFCDAPIHYSRLTYGHLGDYSCSRCDFRRPEPTVRAATVIDQDLNGSTIVLDTPVGRAETRIQIPGIFNVYNATAAAAAALARDVSLQNVVDGLQSVRPAFGRMERVSVNGRTVIVALAKNPTGLNEVMRTLTAGGTRLYLLAMLNDNIADGLDVSWIWDADVELLRDHIDVVVFSGRRAEDFALRFKYASALPADPGKWATVRDPRAALEKSVELTPVGETLVVVPTYTAMLELRAVLTRLGHVRAFWEE